MSSFEILRHYENDSDFFGCDFSLKFEKENIKILQITDTQIIDSGNCRTPDRLRRDEIAAWKRENIKENCFDHIEDLILQTEPDVITITGDIIYGSFDDDGEILQLFIDFMDSFEIPWIPVFGNHDNESYIGIDKQCEMLSAGRYCLFERGNVSGNSNFTVGIFSGDKPKRIFYMLDSKGCKAKKSITTDQLQFVKNRYDKIKARFNAEVPGFMFFHVPVYQFLEAEIEKGYITDERKHFILGIDVPPQDGDFGFDLRDGLGTGDYAVTDDNFLDTLYDCKIDGVFVGHYHYKAYCITYKKVKWVYGLKTGVYDCHSPGLTGGTLISLKGGFSVRFIKSFLPIKNIPCEAPCFKKMFVR